MSRFNPFKEVNGEYGAPMGRAGHSLNQYTGGKLFSQHCGGDGFYDRGGAYWGHSNVYAVYTKGGDFCTYVDAASKSEAIKSVQEETGIFWNIKIYDAGPDVGDRFTAVFIDRPERDRVGYKNRIEGQLIYEALAFNSYPFHPQGVGMHVNAVRGKHLGKLIDFYDLSKDAQKFIIQNI